MAEETKILFEKVAIPTSGTVVLFADQDLALGAVGGELERASRGLIAKAAKTARFTGKSGTALDLVAPAGLGLDRLIVIGVGATGGLDEAEWTKLGGVVAGKVPASAGSAVVVAETAAGAASPENASALAFGFRLGAYVFDRYKTKKKEGEGESGLSKLTVLVANVSGTKKAYVPREAVGDGVVLARDLVNTAPNDLGPPEFAEICRGLSDFGVEVEVLTEKEMAKLGMRALLGVGQGSARGSRLAVMHWKGAKTSEPPVCLIGKGVTFDTGGISIKPAQNMEDMKGDMAGAAAVVGAMRALAGRKAKAHVVGIVGLVENMPDGNAQRPGDVVVSMSGQTIEIINTDAEGRLVLADALWYAQERFKPKAMVDLATLTGAIMVALGHENAGLFANDDTVADGLIDASKASGEKIWRMPLSAEYDKLMDSKVADMKNSGGRYAGAISAAQFLQRFVNSMPWAHLDIAGTGFGVNATETNKSWGPGFGVRLLDRWVADRFED
jgi:leucyl aminopeptidase